MRGDEVARPRSPDARPSTATLVDRLRALDTCAVSDALDAHGLATTVLGLAPVWPVPHVVAGVVRTIRAGPRPPGGPAAHIAAAAVDAAGPDDVLVIANDGRLDVSCWGGILSHAAVMRGVAGTLVDGACRDARESHDLGFPVFARAVVPVSARGRVVQAGMDQPIRFGGVVVSPGDYVVADGDGVAFVPGDRGPAVVAFAERLVAREAAMAAAVAQGRPVSEVMHDSEFPAPAEPGP